jgi:hypothetical protein
MYILGMKPTADTMDFFANNILVKADQGGLVGPSQLKSG